jgi:hypothetical protein
MNEPKKRGRPSNSEIEAKRALIGAEMRAGVEIATLGSSDINPAQEYAQRVWDGQSPSLSRHERLGRVQVALEAQGLSMEGVKL